MTKKIYKYKKIKFSKFTAGLGRARQGEAWRGMARRGKESFK